MKGVFTQSVAAKNLRSLGFARDDNRLSSEFVFLKQGGVRFWIKRELLEKLTVETFLEADSLFNRADCKIIKDQKKIKVGRLVLEIAGKSTAVFLKKYNAFSWRYRLLSLFSDSGAYRSLRGAAILTAAEIQTAAPLAAVEWRRWGMLERSIFLSQEIASAKTADAHWLATLAPLEGAYGVSRRQSFLVSLAQVLRKLHAKAIYHNDLKDANLLVRADPEGKEYFFLLDLEGVRQCVYLSNRRRIKNLVQLNRTLGRWLSRTQKLALLRNYLGDRASDRKSLECWIRRLQRATARADQRSFAKNSQATG
ncbi:MAG TPA: lipopolysaccharide kinase InaA family protein [Candidatus Binatia bacterium]|nr:lipopolysaccharide kinase InaA family protein [Candidatus Binatia bacterium]